MKYLNFSFQNNKTMKKRVILEFLSQFNTGYFEQFAEPSAIAYESYVRETDEGNLKTSFWYFEKIYKEWISE